MDYKDFNCWAKNHITNENMFNSDGNIIMKNKNNHKTTGIIADIFEDWWDKLYKIKKEKIDAIRPNAPIEIKKVIDCANNNLGSSVYTCPKCDDEVYFCHHTCKGKLCSSCGIKVQNERTENILEKCITSKHRHMTFTMPKILTSWFISDLFSLNIIFEAVCETMYSVCNGKFKKKTRIYNLKYKPGFFAFLHTYGRPLNFNPHIHVIFAENLLYENSFKKCSYLDYDALSKRFMFCLLSKMEKYFGKSFRNTKNQIIKNYPNGFYVNNKLEDDGYKFNSIEELLKYVTRYCSRPAIAESRIINYDGENVTWFYVDHKEEKRHVITESAISFIIKIIKHLLPTNFKSIRSYGFYNKPSKLPKDTNMLISKEKIPFRKSLLKWCNSIMKSWNIIPIMCPRCGTLMEYSFCVT